LKGIPHLVKMHEKYGKDGLVVIPVTLDGDPDEKERAKWRDETNKFLAAKKLPFQTYDLDFDRAKPPAPLSWFDGTPRVFVFNRDNKFSLRLPTVDENREVVKPAEKEDIEKAIEEAVKKK
jgi:hypothetical protein